jgi:hypothetical protein
MILLVAAIISFDLRLLGLLLPTQRVSTLARRLLPCTWLGFAIQLVSGLLLFSSEAVKLYDNPTFRLKLLLILFAGANALLFHLTIYRRVSSWDDSPTTPLRARLSAVISILVWLSVVAAGRFIGFV